MPSKLITNTFFYALGVALPQAAMFILLPIYTRYLSPSDYGVLSNIQAINSVLVILFTLSIHKAITRMYFDIGAEQKKKDYLGTVFIGLTACTIIMTGVCFLFSGLLGSVYKSIEFYPYLALGIGSSAITTLFLVAKKGYFVKEKANIFVLLSLLEFITKNVFIIFFVVVYERGPVGYLYANLFASLLLLPFFLFLTVKQVNITFDISLFMKSLRFSLPFLPTLLSAWVMNLSDRIFIERFFNTHEVGVYSLAYNLSMVIAIVISSFYQAYNPYYYKVAAKHPKPEAINRIERTNTVFVLLTVVTCSLVALFAKEVIYLIFDDRYREAYKIVPIICLSYVFGQSVGVFNLAIKQEKKTVFFMYAAFIGALVNIALNFILVRNFGAYGAAWATVFTFMLLYLVTKQFAKKCFYASFRRTIVYSLFLLLLLGNVLFYVLDLDPKLSVPIKTIFIFAIVGYTYYKFKQDIRLLFKYRSEK